MKRISTLLYLSLITLFCSSQTTTFDWAQKYNIGSGQAAFQGTTLLLDNANNIYVFGVHNTSTNSAFAVKDMIFAKFDSTGNVIWYKHFPTETFSGHGHYKMKFDQNNDIIVVGEMNVVFGTDSIHKYGATLNSTVAIVKFDNSGNYLWGTQIDADLKDDFDFEMTDNGTICIRGEGIVTYKEDSTLFLNNQDFIAAIDPNGTVITAKPASYNVGGTWLTKRRKIIAKGNNLASFSYRTGSFGVNEIVYTVSDPITGVKVSEQILTIKNLSDPSDYLYNPNSNVAYFFTSATGNEVIIQSDTINSTTSNLLLIKYDLTNENVLTYQEYSATNTSMGFDYAELVGLNALSFSLQFRDSCKNETIDSSYYVLPNSVANQHQYLLVNLDTNLVEMSLGQYATGGGTLSLWDLERDAGGNIYGVVSGTAKTYFGSISIITGTSPSKSRGEFFKFGKENNGSTGIGRAANEIKDILVFPNPTHGILTIGHANDNIQKVTLHDQLGRQILRTKRNVLELDNVQNGIYFVTVELNDGSIFTKKIVKE